MTNVQLVCPSCGGNEIRRFELNGRLYFQCFSIVTRVRGNTLRTRRETVETCKYWSTKESAWLPKTSS